MDLDRIYRASQGASEGQGGLSLVQIKALLKSHGLNSAGTRAQLEPYIEHLYRTLTQQTQKADSGPGSARPKIKPKVQVKVVPKEEPKPQKLIWNLPVEIDRQIIRNMPMSSLLNARATDTYLQGLADEEILRRHAATYDDTAKSLTNKIRDLIIDPIITKLRGKTLEYLDTDYGLIIAAGANCARGPLEASYLRTYPILSHDDIRAARGHLGLYGILERIAEGQGKGKGKASPQEIEALEDGACLPINNALGARWTLRNNRLIQQRDTLLETFGHDAGVVEDIWLGFYHVVAEAQRLGAVPIEPRVPGRDVLTTISTTDPLFDYGDYESFKDRPFDTTRLVAALRKLTGADHIKAVLTEVFNKGTIDGKRVKWPISEAKAIYACKGHSVSERLRDMITFNLRNRNDMIEDRYYEDYLVHTDLDHWRRITRANEIQIAHDVRLDAEDRINLTQLLNHQAERVRRHMVSNPLRELIGVPQVYEWRGSSYQSFDFKLYESLLEQAVKEGMNEETFDNFLHENGRCLNVEECQDYD